MTNKPNPLYQNKPPEWQWLYNLIGNGYDRFDVEEAVAEIQKRFEQQHNKKLKAKPNQEDKQ
jgi:hypothetical protein